MTQDDIIRMAREAGFPGWWLTPPEPERQHGEALEMLERFAALVAAAEREACATIADRYAEDWLTSQTAQVCAAAIRARNSTQHQKTL